MTLFDIIGLLILAISSIAGLARGAIREVSNAGSFIASVFISIFALRYTGPAAVAAVKPAWAANTVAVVVVFLAVYVLLRVIAGALTRSVHQTKALGAADRLIGGGFGLVRGLVLLGVIGLLLNAAMPNATPSWVANAKLYPLSRASATALRVLAPKGSALAGRLKPQVDAAISAEGSSPSASSAVGQSRDIGYSAAARKGLDDVVERSR